MVWRVWITWWIIFCTRYILKKHETVIDNPAIRIYINKTENGITLKLKQDIILNF